MSRQARFKVGRRERRKKNGAKKKRKRTTREKEKRREIGGDRRREGRETERERWFLVTELPVWKSQNASLWS